MDIILFGASTAAITAAYKSLPPLLPATTTKKKKKKIKCKLQMKLHALPLEKSAAAYNRKIKIIKQSTAQTEAAAYLDGESSSPTQRHLKFYPPPLGGGADAH